MANLHVVEGLRLELQLQVDKLQQSLKYWQTWEADYDGFREEIDSLPDNAAPDDILAAGIEFGGNFINEREVKDLLALEGPRPKSRKEMLAAISARVEIGCRNAASVKSQLSKLQQRLDGIADDSRASQMSTNEIPIMEIVEELDESDNVLSSKVVNAQEQSDRLDEALRKNNVQAAVKIEEAQTGSPTVTRPSANNITPLISTSTGQHAQTLPGPTFESPIRESTRSSKLVMPTADRMLELDENDQILDKKPLNVFTPSSDDIIRHQREFMRNAAEIGPIVATMDIEEGSDFSDMDLDEEDGMYDPEDPEENEFGMSAISNELTPEYLAEMKALMAKYQSSMHNIGPQDAGFPRPNHFNKLPTPVLEEAGEAQLKQASPKVAGSGKKGVRFADQLDVSDQPISRVTSEITASVSQPVEGTQNALRSTSDKSTIVDVIERKPSAAVQAPQAPSEKPKRMSRFKQAISMGDS